MVQRQFPTELQICRLAVLELPRIRALLLPIAQLCTARFQSEKMYYNGCVCMWSLPRYQFQSCSNCKVQLLCDRTILQPCVQCPSLAARPPSKACGVCVCVCVCVRVCVCVHVYVYMCVYALGCVCGWVQRSLSLQAARPAKLVCTGSCVAFTACEV